MSKGHICKVGFKTVYDMEPEAGLDVNYEALSTKPSGVVRVIEATKLNPRESNRNW